MKKFSIILNVVLVLVTLFFGVFAMLKSIDANKNARTAEQLMEDAVNLRKHALAAQMELELCENQNQ